MNDQINPATPETTNGHAGQTETLTAPVGQTHSGTIASAVATDPSKDAPRDTTQQAINELKSQGSGSATNAAQDAAPRPSPGRIVSYTITAYQAREINNRRAHADAHRAMHKSAANGTVIHMGSTVTEGRRFPMIITAVHGDAPTSAINGQVFLDGNDSLWVTSVTLGDQPGNYSWSSRD